MVTLKARSLLPDRSMAEARLRNQQLGEEVAVYTLNMMKKEVVEEKEEADKEKVEKENVAEEKEEDQEEQTQAKATEASATAQEPQEPASKKSRKK